MVLNILGLGLIYIKDQEVRTVGWLPTFVLCSNAYSNGRLLYNGYGSSLKIIPKAVVKIEKFQTYKNKIVLKSNIVCLQ